MNGSEEWKQSEIISTQPKLTGKYSHHWLNLKPEVDWFYYHKSIWKNAHQKSTIYQARYAKKSNTNTLCFSKRYKKNSSTAQNQIDNEINAF